jgi:hypothetical protein
MRLYPRLRSNPRVPHAASSDPPSRRPTPITARPLQPPHSASSTTGANRHRTTPAAPPSASSSTGANPPRIGATCGHGHRRGPSGHGQGRAQPRRLGGRGLSGGRAGTTKGGRGLADSGRAGAAAPGEHNDAGSPAVGRARRGSGRARVTGGGGGGNSPSTPARLRVGERSSGRARQREGSPAVERARGHRRRRTDCYWHQGTAMNCPQVCPINHPANSTLFSFLILC